MKREEEEEEEDSYSMTLKAAKTKEALKSKEARYALYLELRA